MAYLIFFGHVTLKLKKLAGNQKSCFIKFQMNEIKEETLQKGLLGNIQKNCFCKKF